MRKLSLLAAVVAAAATFVVGTGTAGAEGADVLRFDAGCFVVGVGAFPCTAQRVETPTGEIHYWVKGKIDPAPPATIHFDNASTGQICVGDAPYFQGVATKSGNISYQCRSSE